MRREKENSEIQLLGKKKHERDKGFLRGWSRSHAGLISEKTSLLSVEGVDTLLSNPLPQCLLISFEHFWLSHVSQQRHLLAGFNCVPSLFCLHLYLQTVVKEPAEPCYSPSSHALCGFSLEFNPYLLGAYCIHPRSLSSHYSLCFLI